MSGLIKGVDAVVLRYPEESADRLGNPVKGEPTSETVRNVLVTPGRTSDLDASRPEGVNVALTLHFPKGYGQRLEGCEVALTGDYAGTYRVVGDPLPYIEANTPGEWNLPVEVEEAHG